MDLDFLAISVVIGALLPLAISYLTGTEWSATTKRYLATGISIVVAVISVGAQEGWTSLDVSTVIGSIGLIVAFTQTTYASFWKGQPVNNTLADTSAGLGL